MIKTPSRLALLLSAPALLAAWSQSLLAGPAVEPQPYTYEATPKSEEFYRLIGIYQYFQADYLGSANAVAYTLELESKFTFERFEIENRIILDYADYPAEIEDFLGDPFPVNGAGSGFGDLLMGNFFAPKNQSEHFHWGFGPLMQAPTASDDHLGSGKWTLGPGVHLEYHKDRVSAGMFLWNSWSIAGDSKRKDVNQMTMKPYFIYELTDDWSLLYVPLGISASWDKPSSQRWKIPIGGGVGRKFHVGSQELNFQTQGFYSVARPDKAAEWSLRFTLEMPF